MSKRGARSSMRYASSLTHSLLEESLKWPQFGHALGLMHEHQSPARNMIYLNEKTTIDFYRRNQHWTEAMVRSQILNVYNTADIGRFSQPDTASIMQYPVPAELSFTGEPIPYSECAVTVIFCNCWTNPRVSRRFRAVRDGQGLHLHCVPVPQQTA
jgi:hypothetical protein